MPYSLKGACVIRSDTGQTVKCHPTRAKARAHLRALYANVPEAKAVAEGSAPAAKPQPHFATASERARHAALVRYGKEQALGSATNPTGAAYSVTLPKEKKGKAGGKGKGKAGAKGKQTPEQKKQAQAQQKAANREAAMGKIETRPNAGAMAALDALRSGAEPDKDMAEALSGETGLVEKHADGSYALSASGKQFLNSLDKGDVAGAKDALGRGSDVIAKEDTRQAKQKTAAEKKQQTVAARAAKQKQEAEARAKRQQAVRDRQRAAAKKREQRAAEAASHKGLTMISLETIANDLAVKVGARHSAGDRDRINQIRDHASAIHDHATALGADQGGADEEGAAVAEMKAIYDDPAMYAMHECQDISSAAGALTNLAYLLQSELSEGDEEEDTIPMLVDAARTLLKFIENELDEVESGGEADEGEPGSVPAPVQLTGKAIAKREDVSAADKKRAVAEYGDVEYADEKNKKYPLSNEEKIRAAWSYIGQEKNQAMYSAAEVATIKRKIVAAWKDKIDPDGPPAAQGKALDIEQVYGSAIKALSGDTIGGYAVLFGASDTPDLSEHRDYFTKSTDYWLDRFGWPRPMTYHHGLDPDTADDPIVGTWTKAVVKDEGIWLEGQLDRAHRYHGAIKELIKRGYLKLSSDSAPQWVVRERQDNGTNEVKRWPLITASPTVVPAEPRLSGVSFKVLLAELGLDAIDNPEANDPDARERLDAAKAAEERARRLMLELDLLELEQVSL